MTDVEAADEGNTFITVAQAVKLIPRSFEENPRQLREFIEGVEAAIEVVRPDQRDLLLKFVVAKIQGDAKDKLLARVERHTWKQIKGILEENYLVKRTLEYYTGLLFNSRQAPSETVAQWGARLDRLAMDLRTEAKQRLHTLEVQDHEQYVEGGLKLIGEFLKGTFIAGLKDESIRVIVKAKGEDNSLAQMIETAIEEECQLKSQGNRKPHSNPQWYHAKLPIDYNLYHGDPKKTSQYPIRYSGSGRSHLAEGRSQPGGSQGHFRKQGVRATPVLNNCYGSWQPVHTAERARNSDPQRPQFSQSKQRPRCPRCGRKGHVSSQCWHRDPRRAQSPHHTDYQGNGTQGGSGSRGSPAAEETAGWK
jgi:hypothetical protein